MTTALTAGVWIPLGIFIGMALGTAIAGAAEPYALGWGGWFGAVGGLAIAKTLGPNLDT